MGRADRQLDRRLRHDGRPGRAHRRPRPRPRHRPRRHPRVPDYLTHVIAQADAAHSRGLSWSEAAAAIDLDEYATWLDAERVVVNVYKRYREIDPETPVLDRRALLAAMAQWDPDRGR